MFAGCVNRVARVFPSDVSKLALAGAPHPELVTLALLKKRLSDDFTVFHGVHWSREYAKWTHFGEVDFVVVNRNGDVLLIEQKNGALVDGDNGLVKQYEDGDKNVIHDPGGAPRHEMGNGQTSGDSYLQGESAP